MRGGRVHTILDNLIAQKKARPMIVAMPDGRGVTPFDRKGKTVDRTKNFDEFEASMLRDVVPFVEKNYRASQRREDRAVAGFSVGAALACRIGLRHLDRFAWVGLLSGGTRLADGFEATLKPRLAKPVKTNEQLGLLWVSGPPKGSAKNAAHPFFAKLNQAGIRYESRPDRFGHSYRTCRHILHDDFLPRLFWEPNR
jgi:enterochelin esterase family protein